MTTRNPHFLWTDLDRKRPSGLCDRNGHVVLDMCKVCGQAEGELEAFCPGSPAQQQLDALAPPTRGEAPPKPFTVPEALERAAATYRERNLQYGDNYKRFGDVMCALFPDGIELRSRTDHNRFGVFVQMVAKFTRYTANFAVVGRDATLGHPDSLHDLSVYAAMLLELDQPGAER